MPPNKTIIEKIHPDSRGNIELLILEDGSFPELLIKKSPAGFVNQIDCGTTNQLFDLDCRCGGFFFLLAVPFEDDLAF